jgi:hypothetical protein
MDRQDRLVEKLPFQNVSQVIGFFPDLQHYAVTYYVAGILAFFLFVGIMLVSGNCCGVTSSMRECAVFSEGMEICCMACNPVELCRCEGLRATSCLDGCLPVMVIFSTPEIMCACLIILALLIMVIGFLAVIAAFVLVIARVIQRYIRLKEMGLLVEEYSVVDLSLPEKVAGDQEGPVQQDMEKRSAVAVPAELDEESQAEIQKAVEEELRSIFGGGAYDRALRARLHAEQAQAERQERIRRDDVEGYGATDNADGA